MIVGIRSVILCDEVQVEGEVVSAVGLHGYAVEVSTRPGAASVSVLVHMEVDRTPTRGFIRIQAADYDETFAFDLMTNEVLAALHLPLFIPVLTPGLLKVSVVDHGQRRKDWGFRWTLAFTADAEAGDMTGPALVTAGRETARVLRDGLVGPGAMRAQ